MTDKFKKPKNTAEAIRNIRSLARSEMKRKGITYEEIMKFVKEDNS